MTRIKHFVSFLALAWCLFGCSFENAESEICFIGDSITNQWDIESFFPGYYIHKHAVDGARVQHSDNWNLSDCKGLTTFFLMGTNDIGFMDSERANIDDSLHSFAKVYAKKAASIQADPLVFVSILPRNYKKDHQPEINKRIELQNKYIKEQLDSNHVDYKYLDIFNDFLKQDYIINEDLFRDGLHPSPEGYELLSTKVNQCL